LTKQIIERGIKIIRDADLPRHRTGHEPPALGRLIRRKPCHQPAGALLVDVDGAGRDGSGVNGRPNLGSVR
jgi:hypothetical protein